MMTYFKISTKMNLLKSIVIGILIFAIAIIFLSGCSFILNFLLEKFPNTIFAFPAILVLGVLSMTIYVVHDIRKRL